MGDSADESTGEEPVQGAGFVMIMGPCNKFRWNSRQGPPSLGGPLYQRRDFRKKSDIADLPRDFHQALIRAAAVVVVW